MLSGIVAGLLMFTVTAAQSWSVELGEPMPDFSIQTFDGKVLARTDMEGRPALLVFWNTWCASCRRELPSINRLAEKFGPQGLAVLAINTGFNDSEDKARTYWKKYAFGFPAGFDHRFAVGQSFQVRGVPTIFLVDALGIVRYKQASLPNDIDQRLKQLTLH